MPCLTRVSLLWLLLKGPWLQASLYTGRAVCYMKMGKWEEAEQDLLEALNRDTKDANTLSNLISVALHLGKNPARYIR